MKCCFCQTRLPKPPMYAVSTDNIIMIVCRIHYALMNSVYKITFNNIDYGFVVKKKTGKDIAIVNIRFGLDNIETKNDDI